MRKKSVEVEVELEGTSKNVEGQLAVDQEAAREYLCIVQHSMFTFLKHFLFGYLMNPYLTGFACRGTKHRDASHVLM